MSDTLGRLLAIAARKFKVKPSALRPDDDIFEKLGIDSLQALELLGDLEREFGTEIPDYVLKDAKTFDALAGVIDGR